MPDICELRGWRWELSFALLLALLENDATIINHVIDTRTTEYDTSNQFDQFTDQRVRGT